jgi:hypothetical protein
MNKMVTIDMSFFSTSFFAGVIIIIISSSSKWEMPSFLVMDIW